MKLFFASDLHGSLSRTRAMLEQYRQSGANHLILLGDLLNHGPRNPVPEGYAPADVAEELNALADEIISVRGNCDSEVDQMLLDFPVLAEHHSVLLADGRRLFLTHGHLYHPDKLPRMRSGDVLVYGHTHIPVAEEKDGVVLFNPGSITLPKGGNAPSYGLLTDGSLKVIDFEGNTLCQHQLT